MAATRVVGARARTRILSETALLVSTLAGFAVWQLGGHIDTWYHVHYGFAIESFATWPHALLYVGWIASAAPAALYLFESIQLRAPRATSLPGGYALILAGAVIFGIGGMFDLVWHSLFGFEVGLEALVSPSHLVLIYAAVLGCAGLAWAAIEWRRTHPASRRADAAVALALGILFKATLFAFLYSQPFATDYASGGAITGTLFGYEKITAWNDESARVAGTVGMILYGMLLALFIAVPLRALRLPLGAISVIVLFNAGMTIVASPEMWVYVPAVVLSAIVGEAIWAALRGGRLGGTDGRVGYWALGFAMPATQLFAYFVLMAAFGGGVAWATAFTAGAPILAGIYGLIACAFAIPPRSLAATDEA